jgi:HPt (histidine-containing phosphotransfer) domain-containing protein
MNDTRDFDPETLVRLRKLGGDNLIRKLVAVFGEYARDRVGDAVRAGQSGDLDAVARAAHAVRSSAGNVGAVRLLDVATALEHTARAGQTAPIPALLSDLHTAFVATRAYLATALVEAA